MKEDPIKKRAERGVAESFLLAYNATTGGTYCIVEEGGVPDFVCQDDRMEDALGLEVTAAYYDQEAAKGLWDMMRARSDRASGVAFDPEVMLADRLNEQLQDKWKKDYGSRCVLLVHADGPLTGAADFEQRVLPFLAVPTEKSPFENVYVRLAGKNAEPEMVWWQIYPEKRRFYEQIQRARPAARRKWGGGGVPSRGRGRTRGGAEGAERGNDCARTRNRTWK